MSTSINDFTELEIKFLRAAYKVCCSAYNFNDSRFWDDNNSFFAASDISSSTDLTPRQCSGLSSSLCKKYVIAKDESMHHDYREGEFSNVIFIPSLIFHQEWVRDYQKNGETWMTD